MSRGRYGLLLAALLLAAPAWSEPYLAAREGAKCQLCHLSPSGGGMRTAYGSAYAQTEMAVESATPSSGFWNQPFNGFVSLGANLRNRFQHTEIDDADSVSSFDVTELRLYVAATLLPDRLLVYMDQKLAPGGASSREAYVRMPLLKGKAFVRAGKMYLPYGLRLEDDSAFIRQVSGINFETPDSGLEFDWGPGPWTLQAALSNGSAGASDAGTGKQISLRAAYVQRRWRLGASANLNDGELGQRRMANLFATLATGPLTWLGEVDWIRDDSLGPDGRRLRLAFIEGNWAWRKGHNLKLSYDYLDPDADVDEDEQTRLSLVSEYTPFLFLQLRGGLRAYDGIPQNPLQNRSIGFVELHAFF